MRSAGTRARLLHGQAGEGAADRTIEDYEVPVRGLLAWSG
jgi:hypothetical protein